jgi:hypothetical protein
MLMRLFGRVARETVCAMSELIAVETTLGAGALDVLPEAWM